MFIVNECLSMSRLIYQNPQETEPRCIRRDLMQDTFQNISVNSSERVIAADLIPCIR